jgi:4-nitrophenyl phosphatase
VTPSEPRISPARPEDLRGLRGFVIDMDGVLWRGDQPLPGLARFFQVLRRRGLRFILATNNNTRTPAGFAAKAASFGADVRPEEVITATTAALQYLQTRYPPGTPVYAIGEKALKDQLEQAGYKLVERGAAVVLAALDREMTYQMLKIATLQLHAGAEFIGLNPDVVFPTDEGLVPGSGMVLAALQATTGCKPLVIGKPEAPMYRMALERMGLQPEECASLGDRLDTDILGGQRAGLKSILVLSGVTRPEDLAASPIRPDWVCRDIAELADLLDAV